MSEKTLIDNIIPDGSKLDEYSKTMFEKTEKIHFETKVAFSVIGLILYFLIPFSSITARKRKEAFATTAYIAIATLLFIVSPFLWFVPFLGLFISLVSFGIFALWVRSLYLFIAVVMPMKKDNQVIQDRNKSDAIDKLVYKPNSDDKTPDES